MSRLRKRRLGRETVTEDPDVTPFMNLMIVLVPVLLLSMTLTHTRVIELDLPWGAAAETVADSQTVRFEVVVDDGGFTVRDGNGAVIRAIPRQGQAWDYATLSQVMQELKRQVPDKRDMTLLFASDVSYQTLVSVMDRVRSHTVTDGGNAVALELFPEITLGDAPSLPSADGVASVAPQPGDRS